MTVAPSQQEQQQDPKASLLDAIARGRQRPAVQVSAPAPAAGTQPQPALFQPALLTLLRLLLPRARPQVRPSPTPSYPEDLVLAGLTVEELQLRADDSEQARAAAGSALLGSAGDYMCCRRLPRCRQHRPTQFPNTPCLRAQGWVPLRLVHDGKAAAAEEAADAGACRPASSDHVCEPASASTTSSCSCPGSSASASASSGGSCSARPVAVLLHGTGDDRNWPTLLSNTVGLVRRGYLVASFDLRYHGDRRRRPGFQNALVQAWRGGQVRGRLPRLLCRLERGARAGRRSLTCAPFSPSARAGAPAAAGQCVGPAVPAGLPGDAARRGEGGGCSWPACRGAMLLQLPCVGPTLCVTGHPSAVWPPRRTWRASRPPASALGAASPGWRPPWTPDWRASRP